jgi:hypothetical protein
LAAATNTLSTGQKDAAVVAVASFFLRGNCRVRLSLFASKDEFAKADQWPYLFLKVSEHTSKTLSIFVYL